MRNILSVDVEDYFHPSEIQLSTAGQDWDALPSRVEPATRRLLDLFARHGISATFFVLGWVAERHRGLVREIVSRGHELACHSYAHQLVYDLTPAQFRADTLRAKAVLEDAAGVSPKAYRAPSYSITQRSFWALEILAECGFTHDSSIFPIAHDRYGIPGFPRHAHAIHTASGPIVEVPVATVQLSGSRVAPVGGGAYLRLLPYRYIAAGLRRLNGIEGQPGCIYVHPWEFDTGQPRLASSLLSRLRTYSGLSRTEAKLDRLLSDFPFATLASVHPVAN